MTSNDGVTPGEGKKVREIKFRGKHLGNKQWVYGSLINGRDGTPYIHLGGRNKTAIIKVIPETIGQFTNLFGKDGSEIWEGDICEQITPNYTKIKMVCRWGTFQRTMDTGYTVDISGFCFERSDGLFALPIVKNWMGKHDLETLEVIGNIHEHPNLFCAERLKVPLIAW